MHILRLYAGKSAIACWLVGSRHQASSPEHGWTCRCHGKAHTLAQFGQHLLCSSQLFNFACSQTSEIHVCKSDGHAHMSRIAGHIVYFFVADKIAAIAGTIGASPFIVFLAYLAVTFAYKSEKRMIVEQVKAHLVMADIADDHGISKSLEIELMAPVRSAACSITWRCLQKWDGFMGLCAKTDSAKRRGGIWLDKFETVRSGSMLLALQQVNIARQSSGKR